MAFDLKRRLVIAISTRALFDLSHENEIFEKRGSDEYEKYQQDNESSILEPGVGFPLVRAMLSLNGYLSEEKQIEVIVVSQNSPSVALRIRNSVNHYGLGISRFIYTSGESTAKYLRSLHANLFLSANHLDVRMAHDAGIASGLIVGKPEVKVPNAVLTEIRLAFDGDGVLFDSESERVFRDSKIDGFHKHESELAAVPLNPGPYAPLLKALRYYQDELNGKGPRIVIGLVTARNSPADERVFRTLRSWGVSVGFAAFLGGVDKTDVLLSFEPQIFFDDQHEHCLRASSRVPTAKVSSDVFDANGAGVDLVCPICKGPVQKKVARHGQIRGKPFWGCVKYPKCNGLIHKN